VTISITQLPNLHEIYSVKILAVVAVIFEQMWCVDTNSDSVHQADNRLPAMRLRSL